MAQPIVKLVLIRGYTEAYYQLSKEEQDQLMAQVIDAVTSVGAKGVGPSYNCRWSNDTYDSFFLVEYPDIDAAIADTAAVEKLGLFRYIVSETILAIPQASDDTNS